MQYRRESVSYSLRPELLSPAGDWDSLQAAVMNGADAVYLGTKEFNARVHARNFSLEDLAHWFLSAKSSPEPTKCSPEFLAH